MKATTKQTAVEFLVDKLSYSTSDGTIISHHKIITNLVEQAKAMEREQISNAYVYGSAYGIDLENGLNPNNYFKETYESNS